MDLSDIPKFTFSGDLSPLGFSHRVREPTHERLIQTIKRVAVYSQFRKEDPCCISGFIERYGRVPTNQDVILIHRWGTQVVETQHGGYVWDTFFNISSP